MYRASSLLLVGAAVPGAAPALAQNDDCAGALSVTVGMPVAFDTTAATASAPAWPCAGGGGPDLWYAFTATNDAVYTFETCGSTYDTALELFSGGCGALASVACNDDACGLQSRIAVQLSTGDVRHLRVGGWNSSTGTGTLSVSEAPIASPAQNLVHYYLDDMDMACIDSGQIGVDGTYVGGAQGQAGAAPGTRDAVDFEPTSGDHVTIPGHPALDQLTNDLSVAAWIRPEALQPGVMRIFGNERFAGAAGSWSFGVLQSGGLRFTTHGVLDYDFPAANIAAGQWVHVAMTMNALNEVTAYVDGALVGTVAGNAPANAPNGTYVIGALSPGGSTVTEFFDGRIDDVQVYDGVLTPEEVAQLYTNPGTNLDSNSPVCCGYCGNNPNSTGQVASIHGHGSSAVLDNNYQLIVRSLPTSSFGFFLASRTMDLVANPAGSQGNLCLGGSIGRYVGPGQIRNSGATGSFAIRVELDRIPTPTGLVTAVPGDTWYFQAWYRDAVMGVATSNFSDGRRVTFN